jgi:hypothetical protein
MIREIIFNRNRGKQQNEETPEVDNTRTEMSHHHDFKNLPSEVQTLVVNAYEKTVEHGLLVPRSGLLTLVPQGHDSHNRPKSFFSSAGPMPSPNSSEIVALEWSNHIEKFGDALRWCDSFRSKELSEFNDQNLMKYERVILSTAKLAVSGMRTVGSGETFSPSEPSYAAARKRLITCNVNHRYCRRDVESLITLASDIHKSGKDDASLFKAQHKVKGTDVI